jgi:hypothetical protein
LDTQPSEQLVDRSTPLKEHTLRTNSQKTLLSLILLTGIACAGTSLWAYTYSEIKVPGAASTSATGINKKGDIAGYYLDANKQVHGFLLSGGHYTTIDYPGAIGGTWVYGVNDSDIVVGARDNGENVKGFKYSNGHFVTFEFQNWATFPQSINASGVITGYYIENNAYYGFSLSGKTFTKINVPNSSQTLPLGINNVGDISGTFFDSKGQHGFLLRKHVFHTFDVPGAMGNTDAAGLNDKDSVVGHDIGHGQQTLHGFLKNQSGFHHIMVPNSVSTSPSAINDSDAIVGGYYLNGVRSFLAAP